MNIAVEHQKTFEVTLYHTSNATFVFQTHDKVDLEDEFISWVKVDGSYIAFNWRYVSYFEVVELPTEAGK